ncbi:FimD/PapC N-terminal domain-containing protein [Pseudomonas aeruginosa]|nr:FimD/PapC N-terminal domain-containing protein [Pseudomonas aeruginosa]
MVLVLTCVGGTANDSSAAMASPLVNAEDDLYASFNPAFITRGNAVQGVDLSRFETGNFLPAGVYRMDIFVNANWVGRQSIHIINQGRSTRACLKPEQLRDWGVAEEKLKSPRWKRTAA